MHARRHFTDDIRALVARQAGVVSTRQLLDAGLTRAVVHRMSSDWDRVSPGIHLTAAPAWESAVWAGLLRGGKAAAIGAEAAAHLYDAVRDAPTTIPVWVPERRSDFSVGEWEVVFLRGRRRAVGAPSRTSLEMSLVDLAGRADENAAVAAVARALAQHRTTPERVLQCLDARRRTRHSAVLRELCSQSGQGIESALEWRFGQVLARHRLPSPERQVVVGSSRMDALFREQRLVVELDGARDHTDWSRDMVRDNQRLIDGQGITLRYGWRAVTDEGCVVAAQVAAALASRGWMGRWRPCRRCPLP